MARMTREQLKTLWDEIVEAVQERDRFFTKRPKQAKMGPPATPEELAALEKHLKVELPPSYADFLSLYNGVKNFMHDVPLLSTREIIKGGKEWMEDIEEFDEDLAKFPIAGSDSSGAGTLVFDTKKVSKDGEMELVHLTPDGDEHRWPSFGEYLKRFLEGTREGIAIERADRAKLKD